VSSTISVNFYSDFPLLGFIDLNKDGYPDLLYQWTGGSYQQVDFYNGGTTRASYQATSGRSADPILPLAGANQGNDTVLSYISYTLPSGVENLTLEPGAGAINGTGNSLDNVIIGNESNNVITGGPGVDTLTGGAGADTFVFATGDTGAVAGKRDAITDFTPGTDQIDLTGWDADTATAGTQAFRFLGSAAFDGSPAALHTVYDSVHNVTILEGDTNGDKVADFGIELAGNLTLTTADFTNGSLHHLVSAMAGFGTSTPGSSAPLTVSDLSHPHPTLGAPSA
jgi:Ca2+-binding RTX toxin-like protein